MFLCCSENYIDGMEFVNLTESEIKSMVPPIGLVKKIMKLCPKVCQLPYQLQVTLIDVSE